MKPGYNAAASGANKPNSKIPDKQSMHDNKNKGGEPPQVSADNKTLLQKLFQHANDLNRCTDNKIVDNAWASDEGIYHFLSSTLGDSVYIIHPALSSSKTPSAVEDDEAFQGAVNYVKAISEVLNGHTYLNKPIVMIINTKSVKMKDAKDYNVSGGMHWQTCVVLPQYYSNPLNEEISNPSGRVFFIDSLNPNNKIPGLLKNFLEHGLDYPFEDSEGKPFRYNVPALCSGVEFNNDVTPKEQEGGDDCGWWAVYNALMLILTGTNEFLKQFKQPSREPAYRLRSLFPNLAQDPRNEKPKYLKFGDKDITQAEKKAIELAIKESLKLEAERKDKEKHFKALEAQKAELSKKWTEYYFALEDGSTTEKEINIERIENQIAEINEHLGIINSKRNGNATNEVKEKRLLPRRSNAEVQQNLPKELSEKENEDLLSFAKAFYTRLCEHNTAAKLPYSYVASRDERRYDAIARLLELHPLDCTAVCFDGENILVGTNSDHSEAKANGQVKFDSTLFLLNRKMKLLAAHLTAIADHLDFIRQAGHDNATPYHEGIANSRKSFLMVGIAFSLKVKSAELERLKKAVSEIIDDFCEYEKDVKKIEPETVNEWWEDYAKKNDYIKNGLKETYINVIKRYLKDTIKVENFIACLDDKSSLFQGLLSGSKKKVNFELITDGGANTHAEMRVIHLLRKRGISNSNKLYIGISKLCCTHCNLAVTNLNNIEQVYEPEDRLDVKDVKDRHIVRGFHGVGFNWEFHNALKTDEEFLKMYLGHDASKGSAPYDMFAALTGKAKIANVFVDKKEFALQIIEEIGTLDNKQLTSAPFDFKNEQLLKGDKKDQYAPESVSAGEGVEYKEGSYFKDHGVLVVGNTYYGKQLNAKILIDIINRKIKGNVLRLIVQDESIFQQSHSITAELSNGRITENNEYSPKEVYDILKAHDLFDFCTKNIPDHNDQKEIARVFLNCVDEVSKTGFRIILPIKYKDGWDGYIFRKQINGDIQIINLSLQEHESEKRPYEIIIEQVLTKMVETKKVRIKLFHLNAGHIIHNTKEIGPYIIGWLLQIVKSNYLNASTVAELGKNIGPLNHYPIQFIRRDHAELLYNIRTVEGFKAGDSTESIKDFEELSKLGYTQDEQSKIRTMISKQYKIQTNLETISGVMWAIKHDKLPFPPSLQKRQLKLADQTVTDGECSYVIKEDEDGITIEITSKYNELPRTTPEYTFHYSPEDMKKLLTRELPSKESVILTQDQFKDASSLNKTLEKVLAQVMKFGRTAVFALNIEENYWVGMLARRKKDNTLQLIYTDPSGLSIQSRNITAIFISLIMELYKASITDLQVKQLARDSDSGPFVVDNLAILGTTTDLDNLSDGQVRKLIVAPNNYVANRVRSTHLIGLGRGNEVNANTARLDSDSIVAEDLLIEQRIIEQFNKCELSKDCKDAIVEIDLQNIEKNKLETYCEEKLEIAKDDIDYDGNSCMIFLNKQAIEILRKLALQNSADAKDVKQDARKEKEPAKKDLLPVGKAANEKAPDNKAANKLDNNPNLAKLLASYKIYLKLSKAGGVLRINNVNNLNEFQTFLHTIGIPANEINADNKKHTIIINLKPECNSIIDKLNNAQKLQKQPEK